MNAKNILILSAGRRVELVQAFQESLQRLIPDGIVYTTDLNPKLSSACQFSKYFFKAPRATDENYIEFVLTTCKKNNIGMVIPTIDTELNILSSNKYKFTESGINLIVSDPSLVSVCRDKRKTAETYEKIGIDQPEIYDKNNLKFPCFCKPYDGSCSVGALAIMDSDMLTADLLEDEKNMFMELIDKSFKEYTIDAYYDKNGKLRCLVPRERIEVRGGEVSKGATRKNFVYHYLINKLDKLEGAYGCITVQVFANEQSEKIKALEINPRFGGGYPLAYAAGADYPSWLIREYLMGQDIDFNEDWIDNLIMLRYDAKVIVYDN